MPRLYHRDLFCAIKMTKQIRLLDLFSGAGGAAVGYHRAGFTEIVGVDNRFQKRYPFTFVQADALEYVAGHGHEFDVVHCSPPCQRWSEATPSAIKNNHPDLIAPVRDLLNAIGVPYVIENVEGARGKLMNPLMLCGTMFGLPFWRHRYFELWPEIFVLTPPCQHMSGVVQENIEGKKRMVRLPVLITGGGDGKNKSHRIRPRPRSPVVEIRWAINISWMSGTELSQAIPPAYTECIGRRLLESLEQQAA